MVERLVLVDKQKLNYEGIFSVRDLYSLIDNFLEAKGYQKREIKSKQGVEKKGRDILIVYEPWKQLSDYAKSVFKVKMQIENLKDIDVEKEGINQNMNQGKVTFTFDC